MQDGTEMHFGLPLVHDKIIPAIRHCVPASVNGTDRVCAGIAQDPPTKRATAAPLLILAVVLTAVNVFVAISNDVSIST
jgi:hypothetical protein